MRRETPRRCVWDRKSSLFISPLFVSFDIAVEDRRASGRGARGRRVRVDGPQRIATARLVLEPLAPRHAAGLDRFARLWEVARFTAHIPHPYPPGCAEAFAREAVEQRRDGGGWIFAVLGAREAEMVGVADITLGADRHAGELGYAFAPRSWGRGYATETARALLRFGFGYLRLDLIEAHAMVENRASCRVLDKAGLRRIGERLMPAPARGRDILCEAYRAFWSQHRPAPRAEAVAEAATQG